MLCFCKMTWRASKYDKESPEEMLSRVNDRLANFRHQHQDTQELVLSTLDLVLADLTDCLKLRTIVSRWVGQYKMASLEGPPNMLQDDDELCKVASRIISGLLFHVLFFVGISVSISLCERSAVGKRRLVQQSIIADLKVLLAKRLWADQAGMVWEGDGRTAEGLSWAHGFGYDVEHIL